MSGNMKKKIAVTEFVKASNEGERALLSKVIRLDGGKPVSDASQCRMAKGDARIRTFEDVESFAAFISELPGDRAIALGVYDAARNKANGEVSVTTPRSLGTREIGSNSIMRNSKYLRYSADYSALLLVDFDRKGMPAGVSDLVDSKGGAWGAVSSVLPVLNEVARVGRGSTSSGLFNADTGEKYTTGGGAHYYIPVIDAVDIPRALVNLYDRCWEAGYGWHVYSSSGAVLERCIVDKSVRGAERLVFEGSPFLMPPLAQDREERRAKWRNGDFLDTIAALPDLSPSESREVDRVKSISRDRFLRETRVERERIISAYVCKMAERTGKTEKECRAALERIHGGILLCHDFVFFDDPGIGDGGKVAVADILRDPDRYEGETLAHPGEEDYGPGKAIVFERRQGAGVVIHSVAHGLSSLFRCCWDKAGAIAELSNVPDEVEPLLKAMERVAADAAGMSKAELVEVMNHVQKRLKKHGIGVRDVKDRQSSAAAAMRKAERSARKSHAEETSGPSMPMVEQLPPDAEVGDYLERLETLMLEYVPRETPLLRTVSNLLAHFEPEDPGSTVQLHRTLPVCRSIGVVGCTELQVVQKIEAYVRFFVMEETEDGDQVPRLVRMSLAWAAHYNAYGKAFLPQVVGVATLPIVINGTLVSKKGYDPETRLMFDVPPEVQAAMPKDGNASTDAAVAALRFLMDELLVDVSTDAKGKAILVALGCTMIQRHLLPRRPVFFVTASEAGGGKTTSVQLLALAIFGKALSVQAWKEGPEMEKALFSNLRVGPPAVLFDNLLNGSEVRDPAIEMCATSPVYEGRVLGESRMEKVPATAPIVVTGNNVRPITDLATRSLVVKLEVDRERPETRPVIRPNYEEWVDLHRGDLLAAFMSILLLDTSEYVSPRRTRFPEWARMVGDKIEVLMAMAFPEEKPFYFGDIFAEAVADDPGAEARRSFFGWLNGKVSGRFGAADVADLLATPPKPDDLWMGGSRADKWNEQKAEVASRKAELELGAGGQPLGFNPSPVAVGHKLRALANKPVRIEENGMEVLVRLVRLPVTIRDRGHLWELQRMDGAEKEGDLDIQEDPSEWEDPTDWNDEFPPIKPERPGSSFLKSPPGVVFHGVVKNADVDEW